jgi:glutamate N-acetyltransferase/amino-acid N-acetyltransferase
MATKTPRRAENPQGAAKATHLRSPGSDRRNGAKGAREPFERVGAGSATSPLGFVAAATYAGIKAPGEDKLDVGLLASDRPCTAAAMFTRSTVQGAAVIVSKRHQRAGADVRGVIVNSGISNVATGAKGEANAEDMTRLAGERAGVPGGKLLVGSTGVIGVPLPMDKIRDGIGRLELRPGDAAGHEFARAIMTTDTHPKTLAVRFRAARRTYTIGAVAKGSGMIHPDMATMFCFMTTDAPVRRPFLRAALRDAVNDSLNMMSVDGDTSTSDTTAIFANGAAGGTPLHAGHEGAPAFRSALRHICIEMAKMLARDGEGAEKLIEVRIEGAASDKDARAAARTVTASPLVKTAVHGNDPNWGRLLMAVGRSHARIDMTRARAWLGEITVYDRGIIPFDVRAASEYLRREEVLLRVHLGAGRHAATAWGCDMTPEYVHINSDYTT